MPAWARKSCQPRASQRQGALWSQHLPPHGTADHAVEVTVDAGEAIDLIASPRDAPTHDSLRWAPAIEQIGGAAQRWDSREAFEPRINPWAELAQTLMASNEFAFVD